MANLLYHPFSPTNSDVPFQKKGQSSWGVSQKREGIHGRKSGYFTNSWIMGSSNYCYYDVENKEQLYFGLRINKSTSSYKNYADTIIRFRGADGDFDTKVNDLFIVAPDGAEEFLPPSNYFLEIGYDGSSGIIRVNEKVIWKQPVTVGLISSIHIGGSYHSSWDYTLYCEDLYINDGGGSINNGFWGDTQTDYVAVSAAGSENTGFVAKSGGSLIEEVDDYPSDYGASYIEGVVIGSKCTFKVSTTENTVERAVTFTVTGTKMAVSESGVKLFVKQGGNQVATEKTQFEIGEYSEISLMRDAALDGGEWSSSKIDETEFGVEIVQ